MARIPWGYAGSQPRGALASLFMCLRAPAAARGAYLTYAEMKRRGMVDADAVQARRRELAAAEAARDKMLDELAAIVPSQVHGALVSYFVDGATMTRAARSNGTRPSTVYRWVQKAADVLASANSIPPCHATARSKMGPKTAG